MIYPMNIQSQLDEVKEFVSGWPVETDFKTVVNWIMQFEPDDFDIAIRIVKNLNVIGYEDLKNALSIAYSKLTRKAIERGTTISHKNTLFAGLGDNGKSGAMVAYNFRLINEISEENFQDNENSNKLIEEGKIENIVLVDDIVSTGQQAIKEIKEVTEKALPYGIKNIFLLTICGFREGLVKIQEGTNAFTFSAFEYDKHDTVTSFDSRFYEGIDFKTKEKVLKRINEYGSVCVRNNYLGYGNIGSLIVFYYNTPNTTLPIIWSNQNSWIPLFPRSGRINGINSYYKQFDKAVKDNEKLTKQQDSKANIKRELAFFVEGKFDEMFFDLLFKEYKFKELLGVHEINVKAIGNAAMSFNLINKLSNVFSSYIVVLESDELLRSSSAMGREGLRNRIKKFKHVLLNPNIMEFFDIKKIINDNATQEKFDNTMLERFRNINFDEEIPLRMYYEIEEHVFKRNPLYARESILREFVPKYIKSDRVAQFAEKVKTELSKTINEVDDPVQE